jgi:hypothetical protein
MASTSLWLLQAERRRVPGGRLLEPVVAALTADLV